MEVIAISGMKVIGPYSFEPLLQKSGIVILLTFKNFKSTDLSD